MKNKILTLILCLALLAALAVPAAAAFDNSVLDGIIMIYVGAPDEDGDMNYWRGTGFFVGTAGENPQYIVTNCHVVEEFILTGKGAGGGELRVLFDQVHECVDGKGIMLGGYAELFFAPGISLVFILKDRRLLQHLSRISQKVISLFGKRDPLVGPVENNNIHFLFQLVDHVG